MPYTLYDWLMDSEQMKAVVLIGNRVLLVPAIWFDPNASLPRELGQRVQRDDQDSNINRLLRIPGVTEVPNPWEKGLAR